jgi:hypothetical protein
MEARLRSEGGSDHVTFGEAEVLAVFAYNMAQFGQTVPRKVAKK